MSINWTARTKFLLFIGFRVLVPAAYGQEGRYWRYYDLVNKAEEAFVNGDTSSCHDNYDKAFREVDRPFTQDLVIAAQIAASTGDTSRTLRYLEQGCAAGLPPGVLVYYPLLAPLAPRLENAPCRVPAIDTAYRDSVNMRYYRAQRLKRTMGRDPARVDAFTRMEEENAVFFFKELSKGVFPAERMLGLFKEQDLVAFIARYDLEPLEDQYAALPPGMKMGAMIPDDIELWNGSAFFSLLHAPCSIVGHEEELWRAAGNGYLHPKDVGGLLEWLVKSRGNPNYRDHCEVERAPSYFNIVPEMRVKDAALLAEVERSRADRHMQKFAVDQAKRALEKEKGFVFFFGFLHWR